jgi:hypothetical protein
MLGFTDFSKGDVAIDVLLRAAKSIRQSVENEAMDVMMILMPESTRVSKSVSKPYGSYDMPSHKNTARNQAEEPIVGGAAGKAKSSKPETNDKAAPTSQALPIHKTLIPRCHATLDSCNTATANCSGHGDCKKKYGQDNQGACYACLCKASVNMIDGYKQSIYWGGSSCQKEDISAQFWLLAGFSVAAVGLISWGIGLLFSIGEEKLPGVIGAGVSGAKAR